MFSKIFDTIVYVKGALSQTQTQYLFKYVHTVRVSSH